MLLLLLLTPGLQVRLYDVLFKSKAPDALGDSWLEDISPSNQNFMRVLLLLLL
jgi:hypothetical protein